jgi:LacI family transcriptional regulator
MVGAAAGGSWRRATGRPRCSRRIRYGIGALSAFRDAGLRLPEDIAIGGFDDIPMARYVEPALTSMHVDINALGARATAWLLEALHGPAERELRRENLATTLVVRRSCGARSG